MRKPTELEPEEIRSLIQRNSWGVLAMVDGDLPYAVPVIYGYDGTSFVFANGPGRKVDVLSANPRVSLVITEVEEAGMRWSSVIVKGVVEWIEDLPARLTAFNTLRQQVPNKTPRITDAARLATAKVARIRIEELTGRATS